MRLANYDPQYEKEALKIREANHQPLCESAKDPEKRVAREVIEIIKRSYVGFECDCDALIGEIEKRYNL